MGLISAVFEVRHERTFFVRVARFPSALLSALLCILALPMLMLGALPAPAHAQAQGGGAVIALLAPMSGEYASFGVHAWQAAAMAAAQDSTVQLLRFDTAALGPEQALEQAIAAGAHAILGPIGEAESRAVVRHALGLEHAPPIFLLSGVHGLEDPGANIFRLRTSLANQAEALAGAIVSEAAQAGHSPPTFAVFAPDVPDGAEAAAAFVRAYTDFGGVVVAAANYPASGGRLGEAVELLVGRSSRRLQVPSNPWDRPPSARQRSGQGLRAHPQAIFIPDYAARVADLLPHLDFQGWSRQQDGSLTRLYGLSGWASADLARAGDLVGDAIIVQIFDPDDLEPAAESFGLDWGARFGEAPTAFEAQVVDAALFVMLALHRADNRSPQAIAHSARLRVTLEGVCGTLWLDDQGGAMRTLGLWKIDGGGNAWPLGRIEPVPPETPQGGQQR